MVAGGAQPVASQEPPFNSFHTWADFTTIYDFNDRFRYDGDYASWSRKMKLDQHLTEVLVDFDYGPLDKLNLFKGSHPSLMKDWIFAFDWKDQLQYSGPRNPNRPAFKHEMLKYRLLSLIENTFLGGRRIGGFKNYKSIRT